MPFSPNLFLSVFLSFAPYPTPIFHNYWQFGGKFCVLHKLSFEYVLFPFPFLLCLEPAKNMEGKYVCTYSFSFVINDMKENTAILPPQNP